VEKREEVVKEAEDQAAGAGAEAELLSLRFLPSTRTSYLSSSSFAKVSFFSRGFSPFGTFHPVDFPDLYVGGCLLATMKAWVAQGRVAAMNRGRPCSPKRGVANTPHVHNILEQTHM